MDFTKSIAYDGFQLNNASFAADGTPASGYRVESIDISDIEVAAYAEKRALADGIDASDVYLGRRRVDAIVTVYGSSIGDFWDKAQDLLNTFTPTVAFQTASANLGFRGFNFFQPTADIVTWPTSAYPNGIPFRMFLRPLAPPTYAIRRDDVGGLAGGGTALPFNVSLVARDPRKYLQELDTISIASGTSLSTTHGTYLGDVATGQATATIIASATTGTAAYEIANSNWTVNIDTASATYTIDIGQCVTYKNGVRNFEPFTYDLWPTIGTIEEDIEVQRSASAAATSFSLAYRQAFS